MVRSAAMRPAASRSYGLATTGGAGHQQDLATPDRRVETDDDSAVEQVVIDARELICASDALGRRERAFVCVVAEDGINRLAQLAREVGRCGLALACEHEVGERRISGEEALRFAEAVYYHAAVAVGLEADVVVSASWRSDPRALSARGGTVCGSRRTSRVLRACRRVSVRGKAASDGARQGGTSLIGFVVDVRRLCDGLSAVRDASGSASAQPRVA